MRGKAEPRTLSLSTHVGTHGRQARTYEADDARRHARTAGWAGTYQGDESDVVGLGRLPQLEVLPDKHADADAAQVEGVEEVVH